MLAATAALAGAATSQPASKPALSEFAQHRAEAKLLAARQASGYPTAQPTTVDRAVGLLIARSKLALTTTLPPSGYQQISLSNLPGISIVNVRQMNSAAAPPVPGAAFTPDFFVLTHYDFTDPAWEQTLTTVILNPMNLQLARDSESPSQTFNITLMQNTGLLSGTEARVRLLVKLLDKNHEKPLVNIERLAPDFVALRRMYPDDCNRYLGPLLHMLRADASVFSPDLKLIWQVFAADLPPDPAMVNRVSEILTRLDADNYHDRKIAADELNQLGELGALALLRMDRTGMSPEQSSRVNSFLAPYQPVSAADASRLGKDVDFLIDCLFDPAPEVNQLALQHLRNATKQPVEFDASLTGDRRRDAISALRHRLSPGPSTAP